MQTNIKLAKKSINKAFEHSGILYAKRSEAAFHLTDWISDLELFVDFLENPENFNSTEVSKLIIALLVHAPDHLTKAALIILGEEGIGQRTNGK